MKFKYLIILLSLVCLWRIGARPQNKELLVVVLMVKNEAAVICRTLHPFVEAGVDAFFIFDTGSTDGTSEVVAEYFARNKITRGHVAQEPFIDFATSRNRALELAEQQFPCAVFMIMPDAEWYLESADQLLSFCENHIDDHYNAYLIRLNTLDHDFCLPRLIRVRGHLRFVGAVHEDLDIDVASRLPDEIFFKVRPSEEGKKSTKKRLWRDLEILKAAHESAPEDTHTMFYLAQTYACLENYREAYRLFRLCCKLSFADTTRDWHLRQAYQACYNSAAIVDECLSKIYPQEFSWRLAQEHYLEAFSICRDRVEPLLWIAQHYWHAGDMHICYLFARYAAEMPYPTNVAGMIEKDAYEFTRYALLGACAGNIGEWKISEWALKKALESRPHAEFLKENLARVLRNTDQCSEA